MKRVFAPVAVALIVAACGGSPANHHAQPSTCRTMNCVLKSVPAPAQQFGLSPAVGLDFAWTKAAPSEVGRFGASYASHDISKGWSASLISAYHRAGKGTVAVFEDSATNALGGCAAGTRDAQFAEGQLNSWGYQRAHFDMAVDFDASPAQIAGPVYQYFRCANHAESGLVGAYGDYYVIRYLCPRGVIHKSWQTYAWSGNLWQPASCAPLEQYLNGLSFDHDRAIAGDYGQFPTPKPPKSPLPVCVHHRMSRSRCAAGKALLAKRESALQATGVALGRVQSDLTSHRCRKPYRRGVCRSAGRVDRALTVRFRWFEAHTKSLASAL